MRAILLSACMVATTIVHGSELYDLSFAELSAAVDSGIYELFPRASTIASRYCNGDSYEDSLRGLRLARNGVVQSEVFDDTACRCRDGSERIAENFADYLRYRDLNQNYKDALVEQIKVEVRSLVEAINRALNTATRRPFVSDDIPVLSTSAYIYLLRQNATRILPYVQARGHELLQSGTSTGIIEARKLAQGMLAIRAKGAQLLADEVFDHLDNYQPHYNTSFFALDPHYYTPSFLESIRGNTVNQLLLQKIYLAKAVFDVEPNVLSAKKLVGLVNGVIDDPGTDDTRRAVTDAVVSLIKQSYFSMQDVSRYLDWLLEEKHDWEAADIIEALIYRYEPVSDDVIIALADRHGELGYGEGIPVRLFNAVLSTRKNETKYYAPILKFLSEYDYARSFHGSGSMDITAEQFLLCASLVKRRYEPGYRHALMTVRELANDHRIATNETIAAGISLVHALEDAHEITHEQSLDFIGKLNNETYYKSASEVEAEIAAGNDDEDEVPVSSASSSRNSIVGRVVENWWKFYEDPIMFCCQFAHSVVGEQPKEEFNFYRYVLGGEQEDPPYEAASTMYLPSYASPNYVGGNASLYIGQ